MQKGFVLWLTGLPGSGKTTLAKILEEILRKKGLKLEVFDGDEVRKWLSPEAGFSREDRDRHIKRVAMISKLLSRNDIAVIVSLVSPYRDVRDFARNEIENFLEIWIKCSLETCIKRDPKGLYKKAQSGEIKDMTGVQDVYEEPHNPELIIDTDNKSVDECIDMLIKELGKLHIIDEDN